MYALEIPRSEYIFTIYVGLGVRPPILFLKSSLWYLLRWKVGTGGYTSLVNDNRLDLQLRLIRLKPSPQQGQKYKLGTNISKATRNRFDQSTGMLCLNRIFFKCALDDCGRGYQRFSLRRIYSFLTCSLHVLFPNVFESFNTLRTLQPLPHVLKLKYLTAHEHMKHTKHSSNFKWTNQWEIL